MFVIKKLSTKRLIKNTVVTVIAIAFFMGIDWYNALMVFVLPMLILLYATAFDTYKHYAGLDTDDIWQPTILQTLPIISLPVISVIIPPIIYNVANIGLNFHSYMQKLRIGFLKNYTDRLVFLFVRLLG